MNATWWWTVNRSKRLWHFQWGVAVSNSRNTDLDYRARTGSGPSYIQDKRFAPPSLWRGPSYRAIKSRLFAVLAPQWWNELPIDIRTAESLHIFCCRLKTHLFRLHLGPWKKKKTNKQTNKKQLCLLFVSKCSTWSIMKRFSWYTWMILAIFGLYPHGWMHIC